MALHVGPGEVTPCVKDEGGILYKDGGVELGGQGGSVAMRCWTGLCTLGGCLSRGPSTCS